MPGAFSATKISPSVFLSTALGLALAWITLPTKSVQAQPIIPTPNGTGTEVIFNNNQWDIYGGSLSSDQLNLFHQFQQFGLTEGQIANFLANPNLRNIISTVDGGNPSIINGLLQVTGGNPNLFLMNPSGIIFGPNAQLNVPASFSAITADGIQFGDRWLNAVGPNDYSALTGDPTAFRFSSDFAGAIVNAGNLQVNPGAALALMGGTVINTGQLTASQGQILITAVPGESLVRLALPGYILNLEVEVPLTEGDTPQTWQLPITALPTLLTQGLTPELLGLAVTSGGQIQLANGTPVPNAPGTAMVSGGVDVSGNQGGAVAVLGDRVGLVGAQMDVSGTQGNGGQIRVGGEFQGNGPLPNAQRTYVDANTTLNANAGPTGNGGRIIVWADEATGFYGDITARGGQLSGNGGFAEVSGRDYLQFDGTADLSSTNGEIGTLLLDPATITISNAVSTTPGIPAAFPDILLSDFPDQDISINQTILENAASTSRIILQADQRITIGTLNQRLENPDDLNELRMTPTLILGNGATFLVENGIFEVLDSSSRILTNGGDLNITAQSITTGRIVTSNPGGNAGTVNLTATQGDITTDIRAQVASFDPSIVGRGGDIILKAPQGGITVNNNLVSISANGDAGNISLTARNNLVIRCAVGANYCIESFGGGIEGVPSRGNSGSISFISDQDSVRILNSFSTGANAINTTNDLFSAGTITIQAAASIDIGGRILSGGAINNAPISLSANSINLVNGLEIVNDLGGQSQPANININGSVNGTGNGSQVLTINSGRGSVNLGSSIGSTIPIGSLTVSGHQSTVSGDIQTVNSPIVFNSPVTLNSSSPLIFNSGTATITLNSLDAGSTPLTLIANDFNFSDPLQGTNTLTIQPSTLSRGITLGDTVNNTLNLSPTEVAALQGFSNVTIGGGSGNITVNAPVTLNTSTQLITTGNITNTGDITSNSGNITLSGNTINTNIINTANGGISIAGTGAVTAGNLTSNGGGITLDSTTGNVQADNLSANGGAVNVTAPGTVTVPTANGTGGVALTSTGSSVQTSTVTTNGGDVALNAQTNLTVDNITTNGGNIALSSNTDTITVDTLSSSSGTAAGGNIAVLNPNAINAAAINASGATTGGNITLSAGGGSPTGAVTTGNLTATGVDGGGNITVLARDTITAEEIDTSATVGRGGNVLLDPLGDVQVTFINAQGGTNGAGGNVVIESIDRFFRATGAFPDRNGILASISAAGGGGEGTITITHNGGAANVLVPFIISTPTQNGTVGALTTGANNIIFPGSFLGPYTQGNIRIITSPQGTLGADASLPDTLPEEIQPENADNQPFWLDEYFTRTLEEYLSRNPETAIEPTRIKSLQEIQSELREVERVTGVRPAVIYVVFEPQQLRLRTEVVNGEEETRQDRLTNQGTVLRQAESPPGDDTDQLQLVLVTADEEPVLVRIDDPEATRGNVVQAIRDLRDSIDQDYRQNYLRGFDSNGSPYLPIAQQLYDWLIRELEDELVATADRPRVSNLVFIMDNGLRGLPLAAMLPALHDGQEYIIQKGYSVGLMPSFSLTDTRYQDIRDMSMLAMGSSEFPNSIFSRSPLPGVTDELNMLESLWPAHIFREDEFTFQNLAVQRQTSPFGIIHLATHARFIPGDPSTSYIRLWDENVSLNDLRSLAWGNPPVELITLSACNTARDSVEAELGFAGLAVQIGVKSALASIWKVDDFGTFALMAGFYSYLEESEPGLIKAEALRRAQLDMISGNLPFDEQGNLTYSTGQSIALPRALQRYQSQALAHPYLWSGFTIIGNPW